ncbi:MAG: hypothetical protein ACLFM4_06190 [Phormidium sp.]
MVNAAGVSRLGNFLNFRRSPPHQEVTVLKGEGYIGAKSVSDLAAMAELECFSRQNRGATPGHQPEPIQIEGSPTGSRDLLEIWLLLNSETSVYLSSSNRGFENA